MRLDEVGDLDFDDYGDALMVINALATVNRRRADDNKPPIVI